MAITASSMRELSWKEKSADHQADTHHNHDDAGKPLCNTHEISRGLDGLLNPDFVCIIHPPILPFQPGNGKPKIQLFTGKYFGILPLKTA